LKWAKSLNNLAGGYKEKLQASGLFIFVISRSAVQSRAPAPSRSNPPIANLIPAIPSAKPSIARNQSASSSVGRGRLESAGPDNRDQVLRPGIGVRLTGSSGPVSGRLRRSRADPGRKGRRSPPGPGTRRRLPERGRRDRSPSCWGRRSTRRRSPPRRSRPGWSCGEGHRPARCLREPPERSRPASDCR
jgi:hypothetical protein